MIDLIRVIEHLTIVAPFGVSFWDGVTESVVGTGLSVVAYRPVDPANRISAFPNGRGVYVLRSLPGMHAFEHGEGDANFWANLPVPRRSYVIEVRDSGRSFQPFLFMAELPVQGLFNWECGPVSSPLSPLDTTNLVPLYSAPTRSVPGGMAVLRADLWDAQANAPAAWALLEAQIEGQAPVQGFADVMGRVALIFPYPKPITFVPGSPGVPPQAANTALTEQEWSVQLQAFYARLSPVPSIPDLCATLAQPPADLWADVAQTGILAGVTLRFGQELVVQSKDAPSVLLITPAVSPP